MALAAPPKMDGKILIAGSDGQVGSALVRFLHDSAPEMEIFAATRENFDLADSDALRSTIRNFGPRWIVNAAGYTAIDTAENERDAAFAANAIGPGVLGEEAARIGACIFHISSDYVFNGSGSRPWVETDPTDPQNVYGFSKLAGEKAIAASGACHIILRTGWVYSGGGRNFMRTMLHLLSTQTDSIKVVADQYGAPTSADDLAAAIFSVMSVIERRSSGNTLTEAMAGISGVYHCTAGGETTWFGLADTVREFLRWQRDASTVPEVLPTTTAEYLVTAKRPLNCRLNCQRLATNFGVRLPHWRTSVAAALKELAAADIA